jgi:tetratricopeptide (TPR) repeat protein
VAKKPKRKPANRAPKGASDRITVRRVPGADTFELVHPPCVEERAEDIEEVYAMLAAGEIDVAVDELRWLLEGCRELLEAHKLLGEIALAAGDLALARGHLGRAYELGLGALAECARSGTLPYQRHANQAFFQAAKGLAQCLDQLGESRLAAEVVGRLLALDPTDPLALKDVLSDADGQ